MTDNLSWLWNMDSGKWRCSTGECRLSSCPGPGPGWDSTGDEAESISTVLQHPGIGEIEEITYQHCNCSWKFIIIDSTTERETDRRRDWTQMRRNVLVNSDIPNVTYELPLCVSLINAAGFNKWQIHLVLIIHSFKNL